ncbi:uncharacterized protein BJ171DRAFT_578445 [Polychytrium aggregatum]|uniref:uncharacterized protein n=1 Tax=Polychytrium aggregatum TaxID=110093 RepID=UPI0022FDB3C0|nr:uncharacterized protein BJ171DRAFT_578445 [Polychytrium aggregatum]KAI9207969.1 hypothetical protein BJ171DRAFT_578445 [Polychytrium aggregatum]
MDPSAAPSVQILTGSDPDSLNSTTESTSESKPSRGPSVAKSRLSDCSLQSQDRSFVKSMPSINEVRSEFLKIETKSGSSAGAPSSPAASTISKLSGHSSLSTLNKQHSEQSFKSLGSLGSGGSGSIYSFRDPTQYELVLEKILNRPPAPNPDTASQSLRYRRLLMMENVLMRLRDPQIGIEMGLKKKLFKEKIPSFTGAALVDWILINCNFLDREEAFKLAQTLFTEGYIVSIELSSRFRDDSSSYTLQSPLMFPAPDWRLDDMEYAAYLVRRTLRSTSKFYLQDWEIDRLNKLQIVMDKYWHQVEDKVKNHLVVINSLGKHERKLFQYQEYAFWRAQRPEASPIFADSLGLPVDPGALPINSSEEKQEMAAPVQLKGKDYLSWLERKIEQFQIALSSSRVKISQASKSLISRTELFLPQDPLLMDDDSKNSPNPWISSSTAVWTAERVKPNDAEIRIWCSSFPDLICDPLGQKFFRQFLCKEFSSENLDFHLKFLELQEAPTRKEFTRIAYEIYWDYIRTSSAHELNINDKTRSSVIAILDKAVEDGVFTGVINLKKLETYAVHVDTIGAAQSSTTFSKKSIETEGGPLVSESTPSPILPKMYQLPYNVFDEVHDHVYNMMMKDSYPRFCNSDIVKELIQQASLTRSDPGLSKIKSQSEF